MIFVKKEQKKKKKRKKTLGPEAYVSPELDKAQYFAWSRRLSTHTYIYLFVFPYFSIFVQGIPPKTYYLTLGPKF